jgi:alpha-beta hydrolase superfamily lysophospholipase
MDRQLSFPLVISTLVLLLVASSGGAQTGSAGRSDERAPAQGAAETVRFDTTDGVTIVGSYYAQKNPARPVLLLVHMLARSRTTVAGTAERLHEAGFNVLTIDLRGHGDSTQGKDYPVRMEAFLSSDYVAMDKDLDAAVRYARGRLGDECAIGIVGASIGANLALRKGAADPGVGALVLLSPSLDYRGIVTTDAIPRYKDRPIFILTSEKDRWSAEGSAKIAEGISGEKEYKALPGAVHGTNIFLVQPEIEKEVIRWLKDHLKRSKGAPAPGRAAGEARSGG